MADAGDSPRHGAVCRVGRSLVGNVLPEAPALVGPGVWHFRFLAIVGEPEVAAREEGLRTDRRVQPQAGAATRVIPIRSLGRSTLGHCEAAGYQSLVTVPMRSATRVIG